MKNLFAKFTIFTLAVALGTLSVQCTHPYEEGMTGSFPMFELESEDNLVFPDNGSDTEMTGSIRIKTSYTMSVSVSYTGSQNGWITRITQDRDRESNMVTVNFKVERNLSRSERRATINISPKNDGKSISVSVSQMKYANSGEDEVFNGDFFIKSQEDADNFIYNRINGRLIIGELTHLGGQNSFIDNSLYFHDNFDIVNLSNLRSLRHADEIIIVGNVKLEDLSPLSNCECSNIEISNSTSGALTTYNGNARNVIIKQCYDPIYDFNQITAVRTARELILRNNIFNNLTGIENAANLTHLDLEDNSFIGVLEIHKLTEVRNLEYANLSYLDISQPEINFLEASRPELNIYAEGILRTGTMSLTVPQESLNPKSAKFVAQIEGIYNITEFGALILNAGTAFNFEYRSPFESEVPYDQEFMFSSNALTPLSEYSAYIYAIGENGRTYLSKAAKFMTPAEITCLFTINGRFPAYVNSEDIADKQTMNATILKRDGTTVTTESYFLNPAGADTWSFECSAGTKDILFANSYSPNVQTYFSGAEDRAVWALKQEGNKGVGQDLLAATSYSEVLSDITKEINFERLTAKISAEVAFTGNYPIEKVKEISISVNNLYGSALMSTIYESVIYEETATCVFTSKNISGGMTQQIGAEAFVYPSVTGSMPVVNLSIKLNDGTMVQTSKEMTEAIVANKVYELSLTVEGNYKDNTFTIDEIEIVEDNIEF